MQATSCIHMLKQVVNGQVELLTIYVFTYVAAAAWRSLPRLWCNICQWRRWRCSPAKQWSASLVDQFGNVFRSARVQDFPSIEGRTRTSLLSLQVCRVRWYSTSSQKPGPTGTHSRRYVAQLSQRPMANLVSVSRASLREVMPMLMDSITTSGGRRC